MKLYLRVPESAAPSLFTLAASLLRSSESELDELQKLIAEFSLLLTGGS